MVGDTVIESGWIVVEMGREVGMGRGWLVCQCSVNDWMCCMMHIGGNGLRWGGDGVDGWVKDGRVDGWFVVGGGMGEVIMFCLNWVC